MVLSDYTTLAQAFGLDGIQYMIVRGVVPEIMHRSNEILAAMTGGRMAVDIRTEREQKSTKQVVNSLEVWINTITGGNRPYLSHSGGEKVKIALAVTLGLADVKARRGGGAARDAIHRRAPLPGRRRNRGLRRRPGSHGLQKPQHENPCYLARPDHEGSVCAEHRGNRRRGRSTVTME